jgi:hypothetical protein
MASCVNEEIDPATDPSRFDSQLDSIFLDAHDRNGKQFLATVFDYLDRKSRFFQDPEVSKTLARLLRDVKQRGKPSTKPTAVNGNAAKAASQQARLH